MTYNARVERLEGALKLLKSRVDTLDLRLPVMKIPDKPLDPGTRVRYTRHFTGRAAKLGRIGTVVPQPTGCAPNGLNGDPFTYVVWDGERVAYGCYRYNLEVV